MIGMTTSTMVIGMTMTNSRKSLDRLMLFFECVMLRVIELAVIGSFLSLLGW